MNGDKVSRKLDVSMMPLLQSTARTTRSRRHVLLCVSVCWCAVVGGALVPAFAVQRHTAVFPAQVCSPYMF